MRAACILHYADKFGSEASSEALKLAHAALAVSNDNSEATAFAAMTIALMGGNIDTALWASQQALLINPSGYSALVHSGWVNCAAGNPAAALEHFTHALRLSPEIPCGVTVNWVWRVRTVIFDIRRTPWIGREERCCRCHAWRAGIVSPRRH